MIGLLETRVRLLAAVVAAPVAFASAASLAQPAPTSLAEVFNTACGPSFASTTEVKARLAAGGWVPVAEAAQPALATYRQVVTKRLTTGQPDEMAFFRQADGAVYLALSSTNLGKLRANMCEVLDLTATGLPDLAPLSSWHNGVHPTRKWTIDKHEAAQWADRGMRCDLALLEAAYSSPTDDPVVRGEAIAGASIFALMEGTNAKRSRTCRPGLMPPIRVSYIVGKSGRPTDCSLEGPQRDDAIARRACRFIEQELRYTPATVEGVVVPRRTSITIRLPVEEGASSRPTDNGTKP